MGPTRSRDDDDDDVDDVELQFADVSRTVHEAVIEECSNAQSSVVAPSRSRPVYPSRSGRPRELPRRFQDMDSEQQLTGGNRGDASTSALDAQSRDKETHTYAPFTNYSTYLLMEWFGRIKGALTLADLDDLVKNVLCAPNFNPQELEGFDAIRREVELLFKDVGEEQGPEGEKGPLS